MVSEGLGGGFGRVVVGDGCGDDEERCAEGAGADEGGQHGRGFSGVTELCVRGSVGSSSSLQGAGFG